VADRAEYFEGTPFPGRVGPTPAESEAAWPVARRAPDGAPNVLLVVLDDVGYAQLGCFGSDIDTPTIDGLAAGGVRFRNFHTTAMCSPTRSCLLTGRNHHTNAMGAITELANGFPGYHGRIPHENAFLSEILVGAGWATMAVGKWHLAPQDELHAGAPRTRWPLGRGFERFYGFLGAETNQWEPDLVADNSMIPTPRRDGYHLTEDLTDRAIGMVGDLRSVEPDKPFFLYFCPGACHAPHHVPQGWVERYHGHFDAGWDVWREQAHARQLASGILPEGTELSPRPPWVAAWDSLGADERRLYARMMEVFAGFLSHTDHHLGRLLSFLEATGDLEDTIVVVVSDNGASPEGGPHGSVNENLFFNGIPDSLEDNLVRIDELGTASTYGHYPFGWTMAGNTPFKRWKRETHEGGTADPLIVHWPKGLGPGGGAIRPQYAHAVDVVPTLAELLGVEIPTVVAGVPQTPVAGRSLVPVLRDPAAAEVRITQYYEQMGCRAIYHDGWKAVTYHAMASVQYDGVSDPYLPFDQDHWELYHVAEDFSECHDLAAEQPGRLRDLVDRWWAEAGRFDVLPLNNAAVPMSIRMGFEASRERYVYFPGAAPVPAELAVNVRDRAHAIVAPVEVGQGGSEGVVLAHGGRFGGYALYLDGGRLTYAYRHVNGRLFVVAARDPLAPGGHTLALEFERTDWMAGTAVLHVDGREVARGDIPETIPFQYALTGEGLCCGYDEASAVGDYEAPFRFSGRLGPVVVSVAGRPVADLAGEVERAHRLQ
jgi:arylsulfatase A-like enzyme